MGIFPMLLNFRDLRKALRHEIHFPASIRIDEQTPLQTCIIHDISEGGARLTIGLRKETPDNFTLIFSRSCRVVRRTDGQIGVEFLPTRTH